MAVTLGASALAWAVTRPDPVSLASRFTPEHIDFLLMIDSAPQRRAHLAAVVMTAIACGASRWLRVDLAWVGQLKARVPSAAKWAAGPLLAVLLGVVVDAPVATWVMGALALAFVALSAAPRARLVLGSLVASYAAFLMLPGLFTTPDFATRQQLPLLFAELHYAYVISPGDRLAAGLELFTQVKPFYGVLAPTLLAAWERSQGLLTWGGHVHLVHLMNLAFVVVTAAAAWRWFRGAPGLIVTVLFVLPWVASFHSSTLVPNQSGWRFLGLPCAVLVLVWVDRVPRAWWGWALGAAAGALALFNPETAFASAAGWFVFLVLRLQSLRELVRTCLQFAAAALVPVLLWGVFFRGALGVWPLPSLDAVFDTGLRFSGGYGGFGFEKVGLAVAMLGHAVLCVVVAFARRRANARGAVRAAIGTTLIVWFAYYANRASAGNLWSYLALYCFLLDGWLHPRSMRWAVKRLRGGLLPVRSAWFTLVFLLPLIDVNLSATARVLDRGFSSPPGDDVAEVVSGVLLPTDMARALREKAAFAAQTPDSVWVTINAYSIPLLAGRFPDAVGAEPFFESMTPQDTQRLVARLRARRPARFLFDDPASPLAGPPALQQFYARLRSSVEDDYEVEGVAAGWLVLRRREGRL